MSEKTNEGSPGTPQERYHRIMNDPNVTPAAGQPIDADDVIDGDVFGKTWQPGESQSEPRPADNEGRPASHLFGGAAEGAMLGAAAGVTRAAAGYVVDKLKGKGQSDEPSEGEKTDKGKHGGGSGQPPEEPPSGDGKKDDESKGLGNLNFEQIDQRLQNKDLSDEDRQYLLSRRERIIEDIENFDPEYIRDVRNTFRSTLRNNKWDDVYLKLVEQGGNVENEFMNKTGVDPRWRGAMRQAFRAEAANVLVAGIASKVKATPGGILDDWYKKHDYSEDEIKHLKDVATNWHVLTLAPDAPVEYVGKSLENDDKTGAATQDLDKFLEGIKQALDKHGDAQTEELKKLATAQGDVLVELLGSRDPSREMERWVDVEHAQDFYARFQPNQEPRFYTSLPTKERQKWDARWQLARAAFIKKATIGLPDKYVENSELQTLGKDQLEILYKIPGVRQMLESYVGIMTDPRNGLFGRFWDIKDQDSFRLFREQLRDQLLPGLSVVERKSADAVAWNLIWVGNLTESLDSRYSVSGGRHSDLPSVVSGDEYRTVLHPQERGEAKWASHHNTWGAFGPWGSRQLYRIEKELDFHSSDDEWLFTPTTPDKYWQARVVKNLRPSDEYKRANPDSRVIQVMVPECYPVSVLGSFFEETKLQGDGPSLFELLKNGQEIEWDRVGADSMVIYVFKFNKAVKYFEYFNPGKRMEKKPGSPWALEWADPLNELFVRLKPDKILKGLPNTRNNPDRTHQTFHNLKIWALLAANGGVGRLDNRTPSFALDIRDKTVLSEAMRDNRLRYLGTFEKMSVE